MNKNRYKCYRLRKQVAKLYKVELKTRTIYIPHTQDKTCIENIHILKLIKQYKYQIQFTL
jgi:hypothetical protein